MAKLFFPALVKMPPHPPPPPPALNLIRELSSASVDAELARISRTWDLGEIEKRVGAFKPAQSLAGRRKKSFHALRGGSRLKEGHADRIQAAFPTSHVHFWWEHPLARVLCDPRLGLEGLLAELQDLPSGRVRMEIWAISSIRVKGGGTTVKLRAWSPDLIGRLQRIGSVSAFCALLYRYRVEQLLGNLELGGAAMQAIWAMLPRLIRRSRNLRLCLHTFVLAIDYFLGLQPFANARSGDRSVKRADIGRARSFAACEAIWRSDNSIPEEIKQLRRRTARAFESYAIEADWCWWPTISAPKDLFKEFFESLGKDGR